MAIIRSIPRKRKLPAFQKRVMVDSIRGVLRVRKWPQKRGPPRSALQAFWVDWFRQANLLAKYVDGMSAARAIEITKGSRLYPRDVLLQAMRGRLYVWADETGWKWYPMAAIQDISDSLDVLGQTIGNVLVRAADRWRPPPDGVVDDVLTYKGTASPPVWQAAGGGGGGGQEELAGSPLTPDGTQVLYDWDVSTYAKVGIIVDGISFIQSQGLQLRFSTDGGATYKAGASDYWNTVLTKTFESGLFQNTILFSYSNGISSHRSSMSLTGLRAGRAQYQCCVSRGNNCNVRQGFAAFDSPITHIRLFSSGAKKFTGGTFHLVGDLG